LPKHEQLPTPKTMTDIANQAKHLLTQSGSPKRRAVPRVCPLLAQGEHRMIGDEGAQISTWRLEGEELGGPATLLVHGWEDDNSLWTPLVEVLQARGKAVVAIDLPGHGYSQGDACNLALAVRAVLDVARAAGPIDSIASHSFGGVALVQALLDGLDVSSVVLISPPTDQGGQYERSWRRHRVPEELIEAALKIGRDDNFFFNMAEVVGDLTQDALFIHSLDDSQCPAQDAKHAAAAWPRAKFWSVDGLGHRALVKDDEVTSMAAAWLMG
jgi:pimeloyl-ACP methyl ester carboxylesterase